MTRRRVISSLLAMLSAAAVSVAVAQAATGGGRQHRHDTYQGGNQDPGTRTPIKHLVVVFQENVSFDHYFGTYPHAANQPGEPAFHPAPGTPSVNGLNQSLRTFNPNLSDPQRLDRSQAVTCDQDHDYTAEQSAFDHGLMDRFVQDTGSQLTLQACLAAAGNPVPATGTNPNYAVMDYFDGNTVTGLWNYAQHFALSDNSYGTNFGPSTPGAINVTAGNNFGALCGPSSAVYPTAPACPSQGTIADTPGRPQDPGSYTTYSDADPNFDKCSSGATIQMGDQNIGDLLDKAGISWGWFQGGFEYPGYVPGHYDSSKASLDCTGTHKNILGQTSTDYSAHHEPFQYYRQTANPRHLPPGSVAAIGRQDQANHQYDLADFWAAADSGGLPAVSYLKAAKYQDGHAGSDYSDPLDEQNFLLSTINRLEKLRSWSSTAVIIAYDDSDGWYDHQNGPIISQSQTPKDTLTDPNQCGANASKVPTSDTGTLEQARCGVGPRLPLLVISRYAKQNYVDNHFTDQSSVVRFIEDNWLGGERIGNGSADHMAGTLNHMFSFTQTGDRRLYLDPSTGEPTRSGGRP